MKVIKLATVMIGLAMGATSFAEQAPLTIYRDMYGELTPESKAVIKDFQRLARRQGYITLWLTLDYEINLYLDEATQQDEVAAQNATIRKSFEEILTPLEVKNRVWYPIAGPYYRGPGTLIRANVAGLNRLVRDDRLLQIVATD